MRGLHVILIISLGLICYAGSLGGRFVYDDETLVNNNRYIADFSFLRKTFTGDLAAGASRSFGFYRPLQTVTYMIDHLLWGAKPFGYHLTNIILHAAAACALYFFILVLFEDPLIAFISGIFFVCHPAQSEAVAYISGRSDPLALVFILASFAFYIRYIRISSILSLACAGLAYAAALLSRENALTLLLLIPLYHYAFNERVRPAGISLFIGLSMIYGVMRSVFLTAPEALNETGQGVFQRLPGALAALAEYVRILFLPLGLHMEYGSKIFSASNRMVLTGSAILLILLFVCLKMRRRNRTVFFSITWFMLALLPVSNIYPLNAYMAEHWLYLPGIGFFLLAAYLAGGLIRKARFIGMACVMIITIYFSYLTIMQNSYWADPVKFYTRTLRFNPDSERIWGNLGVEYAKSGDYARAVDAYRNAIRIKPASAGNYANLGITYAKLKLYPDAVIAYKRSIELDPDSALAYNNLGSAYTSMGDFKKAIAAFKKAIELDPWQPSAYENLRKVYEAVGRPEEAMQYDRRAGQRQGDVP